MILKDFRDIFNNLTQQDDDETPIYISSENFGSAIELKSIRVVIDVQTGKNKEIYFVIDMNGL